MEHTSFALANSHKLYTEKQLLDFGNFLLHKYKVSGDVVISYADIADFRNKHELSPIMPGQQMMVHLMDGLVIDAEITSIYNDNQKAPAHAQDTV